MTTSPTPQELLTTSRQTLIAILNVQVCPICTTPLRELQVRAIELDRERVRLGKLLAQHTIEQAALVPFAQQLHALLTDMAFLCQPCRDQWNLLLVQTEYFEAFAIHIPLTPLHQS